MKRYYGMAILFRKGSEPWLWSTYDSHLNIEDAREDVKEICRHFQPVMTWIQEYDKEKNEKKNIEMKCHASTLGLSKRFFDM